MEEDLTGLHMTFVHLTDLMFEFQRVYFDALGSPPSQSENKAGLDGEALR